MTDDPEPAGPNARAAKLRLERAAAWTRARAADARARLQDRFSRKPTRKEMAWGGGVLLVVAAIVVFLLVFDWNWLRGPISRYASLRTGRVVRIEGDLKVKLLTWTPEARVHGLRIGHPKWAGKGDTAQIPMLTIKVRLMPLFARQVQLPLISLDRPTLVFIKDKDGRASWKLSNRPDDKPTKLPPIEKLVIRDGRLHFIDEKSRTDLVGRIESHEAVATGGEAAFRIDAKGKIRGAPATLTVRGGPIVNIRKDRPYHLSADVRSGPTHIVADGALVKPFDFGRIEAKMTVTGRDLADLYDLTGATTPNTPPYRLNAFFVRNQKRFEFHRLNGRVGDSDLSGELSVDRSSGRTFLKADLVSRVLDFDDLAAVFGAKPAAKGGESYAPASSGGRMMPDAPLQTERLRASDADVRYRAASIRTRRMPLRQLNAHIKLDHGVLTADPVELTLPRGRISGNARIDARGKVPVSDVDVRVSGVRLEQLLPSFRGSVPVEGALQARAKLHGSGASVRQTAANADGAISLLVGGGEVRKALAELIGINVVPGLLELLGNDQKDTHLSCAVAHFNVKNGVGQASRIVIDTDVVAIEGGGSLNLRDETLDLRFRGKSKKVRILRILAPIHMYGSLYKPKVKAELSKALPQAGIAAALGALVNPLAAVLPFISPGGAKDAPCAALIANERAGKAPPPKPR